LYFKGDSTGSNTGAILAGVLIPLFLLTIGAGVIFFLYRRYGVLFIF